MTSSPPTPPLPPPAGVDPLEDLTGVDELLQTYLDAFDPDLVDVLKLTDDPKLLRTLLLHAIRRLRDLEQGNLPLPTVRGVPVAARVTFEPVFIPPNRTVRHATPAVILTLTGPGDAWLSKVVLQVLPDVTEADLPYRFARAVQTARGRTP